MKSIGRTRKNKPDRHSVSPAPSLRLEMLESRLLLSVLEHLRVTEIMYNPADPTPAELGVNPALTAGSFEYVELKNTGTETLDLAAVSFLEVNVDPLDPPATEGLAFSFAGSQVTSLDAGELVLVVRDAAAFAIRYGPGPSSSVAGEFAGGLSNAGERLTLVDGPNPLQEFAYTDNWYPITDGSGFSLTIRNAADPNLETWLNDDGWRPSGPYNGSPGEEDPYQPTIIINELMSNPSIPNGDWIEFYNAAGQPIDMSGWYLSDDGGALNKYALAPGTVVPSHAYLVLNQSTSFGGAFGLSENGEAVYLVAAESGAITALVAERTFRASALDSSFGAYVKSTGGDDFVALATPTPGLLNASPKIGPVVISEIMYNPPGIDDNKEYIKLTNTTGAPVVLESTVKIYTDDVNFSWDALPWKFTSGVDFEFPPATTVPALGSLIIAEDPAAFAATYGATPGTQILGPFTGSLSNNGEDVQLSLPGNVLVADHYYILTDRVRYYDVAPWPLEADGDGFALVRKDHVAYGNDPANWQAGHPLDTPPALASLSDSPDPVVQGDALTLTAHGVTDDYHVARVEFYRAAAGGDVLLGTDTHGADGWSWTGSTAGFPAGAHDYYARAQDDGDFWSGNVSARGVVEPPNVVPSIGSLSVSGSPVVLGARITVTAHSVADGDGTVIRVEFYRDVNGNQLVDGGTDSLLGADVDGVNGWSWTGTTGAFPLGLATLLARAQDDDSAWSRSVAAGVVVEPPNVPPTIASLTATPDPVAPGENILVAALGVADSDGAVTQVQFYFDLNRNGVLDLGADTSLPADTDGTNGWTWTGTTAGFPLGGNTFFARARDDDSAWSAAVSADVVVEPPNLPPTIDSLTVSDPVFLGGAVTLTAHSVADTDGTVANVQFYLDSNLNGALDAGADDLLGMDADGADGWSWTGGADRFAWGDNTVFARAQDNKLAWSNEVEALVALRAFLVTAENQTVTYLDAAGRAVSVRISKGQAHLYFTGAYTAPVVSGRTIALPDETLFLQKIDLAQSTPQTSIAFAVRGGGPTELGGITGGSLGTLTGRQVDLVGDIRLDDAIGSLALHDIAAGVHIAGPAAVEGFRLQADCLGQNVHVELSGAVSNFQVNEFAGGSLVADLIKSVKVAQGDLGAAIVSRTGEVASVYAYGDITGSITSATFIKTITSKTGGIGPEARITALNGDLQSVSTWQTIAGKLAASHAIGKVVVQAGDLAGNVRAGTIGSLNALGLKGAILSAADSIGAVSLRGDILDSYILSGYDLGMDAAFGATPPGAADVLGGGVIKSIIAKGQLARSYLAAGYLPDSPQTSSLPLVGDSAGFGAIGKVRLGSIDPQPTFDFGLYAVAEIKPFKIGGEVARTAGFFKVELVG